MELKINDKPISEFKDVGELARVLGENIDKMAKGLQETIRGRHSFAAGFPNMGEDMRRYEAVTDEHIATLKAFDNLFGTDYASMKSIYPSKKAEE